MTHVDDLPGWFTKAPEILGVYIREYKNLRDIWLRWDPRLVVLGANGVGKTNLLECCALLMGTDETRRLVERRVLAGLEFDIAVVLKGDRLAFPLEDLVAIQSWGTAGRKWPGLAEDEDWLVALGAREGEELSGSVAFAAQVCGADDQLLATLHRAMKDATVRWRLRSKGGVRTWSRTLVSRDRVAKLEWPPGSVPWPLHPLLRGRRVGTPKGNDPYTDLLALPRRDDVPVDLQWLPYLRTDAEISQDLDEALYAAAPALGVYQLGAGFEATLIGISNEYGGGDDEEDVDSTQWAVRLAEGDCRHQLELTVPALPTVDVCRTASPLDPERVELAVMSDPNSWPVEGFIPQAGSAGQDGSCLVSVVVGDDPRIGAIDDRSLGADESLVDVLSAGERRWFDEAMHSAGVSIRERGRLAAVFSSRLYDLWQHPEEAGAPATTVRSAFETAWRLDRAWTPRSITAFLRELAEPMQQLPHSNLASKAIRNLRSLDGRDLPADNKEDYRKMLLGVIWDELARTTAPRAKVRVFDEPEAHLHSGAVGRLASVLHELADGADLIVSSHHPRFVYSAGWTPLHLRRNGIGRTVLGVVDPSLRPARSRIAEDLGLSRAEAISGASALLLVEGDHDLRVLEAPPFRQQLRSAGVLVVPLRGAYELRSAALVEILIELGPEVVGVMIDNGMADGQARTSTELQAFLQFRDAGSAKGLTVRQVELSRPDIVAYLDPDAVSRNNGGVPVDWQHIVDQYRDARGQRFKDWLFDNLRIDLRSGRRIDVVLSTMADRGLSFEPELIRAVSTFVARLNR